jgi:hypothetical protein
MMTTSFVGSAVDACETGRENARRSEIKQRRTGMRYDFLVETYETERIKVLSVWSEFRDEDLPLRPRAGDPRGRSVREQMVHQCVSEDLWFMNMLGIDVAAPPRCPPAKRAWNSSKGTQRTAGSD